MRQRNFCKAQSISEYVIVFGLVTLVLTGMRMYMKRGIQAGIKIAADELGLQQEGKNEIDPEKGIKMEANITTVSNAATYSEKIRDGFTDIGGSYNTNITGDTTSWGYSKYVIKASEANELAR